MAGLAARMAPEMDAGVTWDCGVVSVLIDPEYPDRPGITIQCHRVKEEQ
jgi:hypothetical protein